MCTIEALAYMIGTETILRIHSSMLNGTYLMKLLIVLCRKNQPELLLPQICFGHLPLQELTATEDGKRENGCPCTNTLVLPISERCRGMHLRVPVLLLGSVQHC